MPAIVFLVLNKPHDCFRCFGKDPDRVFSISQYTKHEQASLRLKQKYGKGVEIGEMNKTDLEIEVRFNTTRSMRNTRRSKGTFHKNSKESKFLPDTLISDKNLLIDSKDPLIFPTIDENEFIAKVAGPLATSQTSINSDPIGIRGQSGSLPKMLLMSGRK